jgi:hypothetical protein
MIISECSIPVFHDAAINESAPKNSGTIYSIPRYILTNGFLATRATLIMSAVISRRYANTNTGHENSYAVAIARNNIASGRYTISGFL